ncbi:MAG: hypothetical protein ACYTGJ_13275 [Planctomycetota bacterium]|jgi:hypothetical protein
MTARKLLGALFLASLIAPLPAQDAPEVPAADLPEAGAVIEKMIEALGGREAMAKVSSRRSDGKFAMPAQGMTATYTEWNGGEGKFRLILDLPPFGKMEQGVTGDVVWESNPMTGGTIQEGEMAKMQKRTARLWPILNTKEDYKSIQTIARETVDGKECIVILAIDADDNEEKWFIDGATHLRVKTTATIEAPMVGKISMTTTESDWREVEGLKFAFKTTIDQSIQKIEIQVESVQLNPETPEGTFSLPPRGPSAFRRRCRRWSTRRRPPRRPPSPPRAARSRSPRAAGAAEPRRRTGSIGAAPLPNRGGSRVSFQGWASPLKAARAPAG